MPLRAVEALLTDLIGLDPELIGSDAIARSVDLRMRACGLDDASTYLAQIRHDLVELEALIEEVTVPETWFFRVEASFEYLSTWGVKHWFPANIGRTLRVLSLACSSGEEPFSVAMALTIAGLPRFEVLGVDVRRSALQQAQLGLYSRHSFRGSELGFRDRFFTTSESDFVLSRDIAEAVRFAQGNALDPALLEDEAIFDVVFCRNLMIYLTSAARARVAENVDRLLRDDGLLFSGHAETESVWGTRFVSARQPMAFAFRKADAEPSAAPAASARQAGPADPPPRTGARSTAPEQQRQETDLKRRLERGPSARPPKVDLIGEADR